MTGKTETTAKKANTDFKKGFEAFADLWQAPSFDAAALFEYQRKNVETAVEINKILFEGVKAATQKQVDLMKDNLAEVTEAASTVVSNKTPETGFASSVEFGQNLFSKNMAAAREVSDVLVAANQKAVALVQERYKASSEELKVAK